MARPVTGRALRKAPLASGFQGRTALVVGGSRGLGRATALALAREGALVLAAGRGARALAELRAAASARGLRIRTARGDASREETARRLVRRAAELGGGRGAPDIVVHTAGDYWEGPLRALNPERWEAIVHSNVTSAIAVLHAALPGMRRRRFGRVLLFGVAGGDAPRAAKGAHAYRAAKVALLAIARSVAQEEAEHGITVNVILPGVIRTPGTPSGWRGGPALARIPARRFGTPGEVARAALFLLAEESGYITGAALHVSGGYLL